MKLKKLLLILLVPFIFLFFQLITIQDYGISWDEPIHFTRGQAYLHYFLTGERTYKNISGNKSYFQDDSQNGSYFLQNDSGHPPTNDILAALTNKIFYQKLNLFGDIDSYHLFNILCSTLLISIVVFFAYQKLGFFPSVFAGVILASYPFLFAESHFNIKDPPQAAFFALTIWLFYLSLKKYDWKLLFMSLLSCGVSLGMKFNILFLPIILLPYLYIRYKKKIPKVSKKYLSVMLLSPLIVFVVFVVFWPYLWQDLIGNLAEIFRYYKQIGTGASYQTNFLLPGGFNVYPIYWIITTSPPIILFFLTIGLLSFFKKTFSNDKYEYLWLLWFLVPILRVSLPNSSIYGGVRQIIEFLPGMILISSIGFGVFISFLKKLFNTKKEISTLVILTLIAIVNTKTLIDYHPNQNVYFNFIIGGLKGAKEKNIPYWGNSFGNAYLQATKWINSNVENNAKIALIQGTGSNIPKIQLRKDIIFSNLNWSGIYREGEYLVELTHQDPVKMYPYAWDYIDNFLDPVYEVKVDGVAIAKVWKNSLENTKEQMKKSEISTFTRGKRNHLEEIILDLGEERVLTRLYIYINGTSCGRNNAKIFTSLDKDNWIQEHEEVPVEQVGVEEKDTNLIPYFFAGIKSKYIRIIPLDNDSCLFNQANFKVFFLEE